jgi:hypothetical protein
LKSSLLINEEIEFYRAAQKKAIWALVVIMTDPAWPFAVRRGCK